MSSDTADKVFPTFSFHITQVEKGHTEKAAVGTDLSL